MGIADPRWGGRPVACVLFVEGASTTSTALRDKIAGRVEVSAISRHAVPDPSTSVRHFQRPASEGRQESTAGLPRRIFGAGAPPSSFLEGSGGPVDTEFTS